MPERRNKNLQKPRRRSGLKPEVTVKRKAKPGIIVAKGTKTEARPEITVKRDTVVKKAKSEAGDQKRGSMSMGDVRVDREGITIGYAGGRSLKRFGKASCHVAKRKVKVDREDRKAKRRSGEVKRRPRWRRLRPKRVGKAWCQVAKRKVKSDRTKSCVKNELAKRGAKGLNVKLNSTVKIGVKSVWAILAPSIALKWMGEKVSQRQLNRCFGKAKAQSEIAKRRCELAKA